MQRPRGRRPLLRDWLRVEPPPLLLFPHRGFRIVGSRDTNTSAVISRRRLMRPVTQRERKNRTEQKRPRRPITAGNKLRARAPQRRGAMVNNRRPSRPISADEIPRR